MRTLIHADIFFFVTAIFVVLLTIFLAISGTYFILILRDMKEISKKVRAESEEIIGDVNELRKKIKEEGAGLRGIGKMFGFFAKKKK
jgi:CHASE3 domain sensor protein